MAAANLQLSRSYTQMIRECHDYTYLGVLFLNTEALGCSDERPPHHHRNTRT